MRLGYLYSRYPVISQTFCDREMLALERLGLELEIGSVHAPLTSLRHEYIAELRAPIRYALPQKILSLLEQEAKARGQWPTALVDLHEQKYGPRVKAALRARNALYFAELFKNARVEHVHVHFANRAAHTAFFLKEISGIQFSVTAHGQDFMIDLGNDDLLREICAAAQFVAAPSNHSRDLLRKRCPGAAGKIHRVYNGIDLDRFPSPMPPPANQRRRILSVGRLVAFKGFEQLIDTGAQLVERGIDFVCEIIGDGPMREKLQARIDKLQLSSRVVLLGALPHSAVFERLRRADIFALPSIVDPQGASDVFPTVILEAMAAALPVVSTELAGIPELVVHAETGLLAPSGDAARFADALEQLIRQPELRVAFGQAGRKRIEQQFRIEQTIAPLVQLFQTGALSAPKVSGVTTSATVSIATAPVSNRVAYLIDRWPDEELPFLEYEIAEMRRRKVPIAPFVCEFDPRVRLTRPMRDLARHLEFLPDAMVIEAEWRANRALAQKVEEERARETEHAPGGIFLRQARFAVVLRKIVLEKQIAHLHATSSRALVCALILQELVDLSVTAAIESDPELPFTWIKQALPQCVGGRVSQRELLPPDSDSFLIERTGLLRSLEQKTGIKLTRRGHFWKEWVNLLTLWNREGKSRS